MYKIEHRWTTNEDDQWEFLAVATSLSKAKKLVSEPETNREINITMTDFVWWEEAIKEEWQGRSIDISIDNMGRVGNDDEYIYAVRITKINVNEI